MFGFSAWKFHYNNEVPLSTCYYPQHTVIRRGNILSDVSSVIIIAQITNTDRPQLLNTQIYSEFLTGSVYFLHLSCNNSISPHILYVTAVSLKPVVLLSFKGRKNLLMVPKRWLRRSQLYEIFHVFVFLLVYLVILGSLVIHRGKLKIPSVWYDSAEAPSAWHSKPRSKCSHAVPKAGYLYRSPTWTHIPHNDQ